jgi:adenine-specific DNA-methyltransferase
MTPVFTSKKAADDKKRRGGYYTPVPLARYLVEWAIRDGDESVLEPSCGDGNFIVALADFARSQRWRRGPRVTAIDIERSELETAKARVREHAARLKVDWLHDDFFGAYRDLKRGEKFDVVVGNPPFIRFQYFDPDSRELAFHHLRVLDYHPTKLANAWSAFVQLSIELVREGGRLALVLPAELLQVKYAAELRHRLASYFDHMVLVGFRRLVFPEIQQEVVLLLAEGKRTAPGEQADSDIHTIEFEDGHDLLTSNGLEKKVAHVHAKHSRAGMKWTALFLDEDVYEALDAAEQALHLTRLGELADVDVGVVTGRNSFFLLTDSRRREIVASRFSVPVVGRTGALRSIVFGKSDFEAYRDNHPAYMLNLQGVPESRFTQGVKQYLSVGEREDVHRGYKCRIRRRWYDVPSVYAPDAFMFRQIHTFPLLVSNEAGVTSTDTIHRVRIRNGADRRVLAATCFNSLTLAWTEVCGRSYGGGVLELEPREAEELPIPWSEDLDIDVEKVDELLRAKKHEEALNYVDRLTLHGLLGFGKDDVRKIRTAWEVLRDRRINRH